MRNFLAFLILLLLSVSSSKSQINIEDSTFQQISQLYKISEKDLRDAKVLSNYISKNGKIRSVWLQQQLDGINIHHANIFFVLNEQNKLVHSNASFFDNPELIAENNSGSFEEKELLAKHLSEYSTFNTFEIKSVIEKSSNKLAYNVNGFNSKIIREYVWIHKDGELLLSLAVRFTGKDGLMREIFIHKASGRVIKNQILTLECSNDNQHTTNCHIAQLPQNTDVSGVLSSDNSGYRVFPFPYESPLNGPRVFLSNPADIEASPFGWHDSDGLDGSDETSTIGNNVLAYDDQDDDDMADGYSDGGSALQFDFPFTQAPNSSPLNNRDASITNLFYANNRLHDVLWHYGFDEQSGNFQLNNYSGSDGDLDAVEAQSFDGGGFNNANFGTPPDGESPRMQMYLWAFNTSNEYLSIQSPSNIAASYSSAVATFGATNTVSPILAQLVLFNDGSNNPTYGCGFPLESLLNKIVLVDRGGCTFVEKVLNAEQNGALAVIVINNTNEGPFSMGGSDPSITIPAIMISQEDGLLFKNALIQGQIIAQISIDNATPYFDSSFDNGIVAHEYGHGVSNRLTGGPLNVDCLYNEEQMGEGWSDYIALMMTLTASNFANEARAIGNYVRGYTTSGPGIRPYPYSHDMAINPVTYNYINDLSIPHGLGSVWCSMLWDMTWDLIDVYGYDSDIINGSGGNNIAFQLVMDGMRLQPCNPGFIDGRDAILLADELNNNGSNRCLIWKAFARRGLGALADQGDSENAYDGIEDYSIQPGCSETDFAFFSRSAGAICKDDVITFTDISNPPAIERFWNFNGGIPASSTDSIVTVTYNQFGVFEVSLNVQNDIGEDDFSSSIIVNNSPTMNITKGAASPVNDNGFIFITPQGGTPPYTTIWEQFPGLNDLTLTSLAPGTYQLTLLDASGCRVDTLINVDRINSVSSTDNSEITIYPNPFDNTINVKSEQNRLINAINIYDVSGRIIYSKEINSFSAIIQTADYASGIYFLQINFNGGKSTQRRILK